MSAAGSLVKMPGLLLLDEGLFWGLKRFIECNTHQAANTRYRPA